MKQLAEALGKMAASMAGIYASRSGQTVEKVKAMMSAETWLSADEAVEMGFADKLEEAVQMAARFDLEARYPKAPVIPQAADAAAYEAAILERWRAWLRRNPEAGERLAEAHKRGDAHFNAEHNSLWDAAQKDQGLPAPVKVETALTAMNSDAIYAHWNRKH